MVEADRHQPLSGHMLDTAMATTGPKVSVQVDHCLADTGVMGGKHRLAGDRVTQAVQDRDALSRAQHRVERRHRVPAVGAAEELPSRRVAALEHGLEPGHRCFAPQPEAGGAGAVPAAWGLAVAGQVRFVVGGQLAGVVGLPTDRELGDVGHHPAAASRLRWREQRTRGALLPSDDCGSSVERAAKLHPL